MGECFVIIINVVYRWWEILSSGLCAHRHIPEASRPRKARKSFPPFINFMNKKIYQLLIVLLSIMALAIGGYLVLARFYGGITWKNFSNNQTQSPQYFSTLDGLVVDSPEKTNPYVVGIMIDNHPDARPQTGLSAAKIVYEASAEGGITRYFAIFDVSQKVDKVGPVRSARPYFVDWLEEYSGLYMHCGGAPEALVKIDKDQVLSANEFYNGKYYWRDDQRKAPHNLYTNSELWNKFLAVHDSRSKLFSNDWNFGELNVSSTEKVKNLTINFNAGDRTGWAYDSINKNYLRSINGEMHTENNLPLVADNVVIQYVKTQIIDDYGRQDITTIGSGDLRVLRDGVMIRGVWKKIDNRTRWYDKNGAEINLKPGKIWIEIVPNDTNIKIST